MSETDGETITFDIEADGEQTELVLPRALVELLATGDDMPTDVVADVAQFAFTRRIYEATHRSEGDVEAGVSAIETDALAAFEAHFGTAFEDLIGEQEQNHEHRYDHGS